MGLGGSSITLNRRTPAKCISDAEVPWETGWQELFDTVTTGTPTATAA